MTTRIRTKIQIWNNLWIVFWLLTAVDFVANKVLDRGNIDVAKDNFFNLKCANKTSGTFASLVWTTTAYAKQGRTNFYSINANGQEFVSRHFANRIKRYNETSLRIHYALLNDTGNYECNILEQYVRPGERRKRMRVQENALYNVVVISPPTKIRISQKVVAAGKGSNVTVDCSARSRSTFKLSWAKENGDLMPKIHVRETTDKYAGYVVRRSFVTLGPLDTTDVGYYVCRVENIAGFLQKKFEVRLKKPPLIQSLGEVHTTINNNVTIQCVSRGFSFLHFKWTVPIKRGTKMIEEGHQWERFSVTYTAKSRNYTFTSTLRVKNVQKRDLHKKYKCRAINDQGEDEKEIVLRGYAMPGRPIIEKSKIGIDVDRIKLQWRVPDDGGKPVESITIEFKNSSSLNDWTKMKIGRPIYSYTVMNLSPGLRYNFKVLATNSIGSSEYSEIVTKKTKEIDNGAVVAKEGILNQLNITSLIGIFGGIFVAVIIAFVCMCIIIRRMQKRDFSPHDPSPYTPSSIYNTAPTLPHPVANNNGNSHLPDGISLRDHGLLEMQPILPQTPDEWEFPRDRLHITTVLGAGEFGIVMRGLAEGIKGSVGQVIVAVKTVRDTINDAATKDLLAELNLLKSIPQHPNVVGLLGCCTRVDPAYVIVEYCANGDLQGFLRSSRGIYERYYKTSYGCTVPNLTTKMLLTFAWQISKGLAHLATMKVIHRDLAARNILVDDQLVCRVSDFGFARDIYVEDHYLKRSAGGRFPIKWMAIESLLDGISTTKSDVWSFGVVLWELVTLGASPYPGMNSYEVVSFLQNGYRMDKPKHCSDIVYSLLLDCWNVNPSRRPSFQELTVKCHQLLELCDTEELIDMKFYQDHLYVNFDYAESCHASASSCSNIHASQQNSIDTLDNIDNNRDAGSSQPLLNGGASQPILNGGASSHQHLNGVGGKPYLPQSMNNLPPVGLSDTDGPPLPRISYNSRNNSMSQSISQLTSNNSLNRTYSNDIAVRMAARH